ncbi:hypothetical protein EV356DRAFT_435772, partial [Viridothelium virens]
QPLKMVPQFSSKSYWNTRFTDSPTSFDWLLPASTLDPLLRTTLASHADPPFPQILHIGCGTSWLSFHLRAHVAHPSQVLNLDFSETAIALGRAKEADLYPEEHAEPDALSSAEAWQRDGSSEIGAREEGGGMRWATADLLSFGSLVEAVGGTTAASRFSVVLDKSTSDAVACAESIPAADALLGMDAAMLDPEAYARVVELQDRESELKRGGDLLDPMIVLALHLAAVTVAGGTWIAVSHSRERFWFLEGGTDPRVDESDGAREYAERPSELDPKRFWRVERKEALDAPGSDERSNGAVHPPRIQHWLYLLIRSNKSL